MKRLRNLGILALAFCSLLPAQAPHRPDYCNECARDSRGRIARGAAAKRAFRRGHPCPTTGSTRGACPGYVIDHVKALKHGGADDPSNMQWETREEAKAKDRTE